MSVQLRGEHVKHRLDDCVTCNQEDRIWLAPSSPSLERGASHTASCARALVCPEALQLAPAQPWPY